MCTVSYLPVQDGFILTSNRDEKLSRPKAISPKAERLHGLEIVFPKDPLAGGTWMAIGENGTALCLLNGAETWHLSQPPYRQSRGLMLLDFWQYSSLDEFIQAYHFEGIEPFTLVVAGNGFCKIIRWNEREIKLENKAIDKPFILSSATLYSPETILQREKWFDSWLKGNAHFDASSILAFHRFGGNGDPENDLVMQRPDAKKTVSISCVEVKSNYVCFVYQDLHSEKITSVKLPFLQNLPILN